MPLSAKLTADYVELFNAALDSFHFRRISDFSKLQKILQALLTESDQLYGQINDPERYEDYVERLQDFVDSPECYVENPSLFGEFKRLWQSRVRAKIKELEALTPEQKQQIIEEKQQRAEAVVEAQKRMAAARPPAPGSQAHVISEYDWLVHQQNLFIEERDELEEVLSRSRRVRNEDTSWHEDFFFDVSSNRGFFRDALSRENSEQTLLNTYLRERRDSDFLAQLRSNLEQLSDANFSMMPSIPASLHPSIISIISDYYSQRISERGPSEGDVDDTVIRSSSSRLNSSQFGTFFHSQENNVPNDGSFSPLRRRSWREQRRMSRLAFAIQESDDPIRALMASVGNDLRNSITVFDNLPDALQTRLSRQLEQRLRTYNDLSNYGEVNWFPSESFNEMFNIVRRGSRSWANGLFGSVRSEDLFGRESASLRSFLENPDVGETMQRLNRLVDLGLFETDISTVNHQVLATILNHFDTFEAMIDDGLDIASIVTLSVDDFQLLLDQYQSNSSTDFSR